MNEALPNRLASRQSGGDWLSRLNITVLNCIDYTLHPTPYTLPSRDVFNLSENGLFMTLGAPGVVHI